jgi:hypothetical protein
MKPMREMKTVHLSDIYT